MKIDSNWNCEEKKEIKGDLIYDDPISRKKGGEAGGRKRFISWIKDEIEQ